MTDLPTRITLKDVLGDLPPESEARRYAEPLRHGTMRVGFYAPRGCDPQTPHTQDELYVVVAGSGEFVKRDTRTPFGPHDVLFAEAGSPHRFENFTDDFACWVIFWGPPGGEGSGGFGR